VRHVAATDALLADGRAAAVYPFQVPIGRRKKSIFTRWFLEYRFFEKLMLYMLIVSVHVYKNKKGYNAWLG